MSKPKARSAEHNETIAPSRPQRSEQQGAQSQDAAQTAKRAETLQMWHQEVQSLVAQEFDSLDAAIGAITAQLGKRMGVSPQEQEFLQLLISTDPTLTAELRKHLRIK